MKWFTQIKDRRRAAEKAKADAEAERCEAVKRNARRQMHRGYEATAPGGIYRAVPEHRWVEFGFDRFHFIPANGTVATGFVVRHGYNSWEAFVDDCGDTCMIYSGADERLALLRVEKHCAGDES